LSERISSLVAVPSVGKAGFSPNPAGNIVVRRGDGAIG
jgi:hypothetical protein